MPTATAEEQFLLELINEARLDPMQNASRYIYSYNALISLNGDINNALQAFNVNGNALHDALAALQPVGALAWSDSLATAAEKHSGAMITADVQSHQVPGEAALGARATAEGYTGYKALGENVYAYSLSLLYGHAAFMVDWGDGANGMQSPAGHRDNIMSARYTEVGIDATLEKSTSTEVGPYVITQDFGAKGNLFVTGVAYNDNDMNAFYSIGEGVAGLNVSWGSTTVTSAAAGGYSLAVPLPGAGVATLTGGGLSGTVTVAASLTDTNLKLDVVNGNTLLTSGSISVNGPVSTIKVITTKGTSVSVGAGNQEIYGNDGADRLEGGAGDDRLFGGNDKDTLNGGDGNDQLTGGYGNDTIDGGAGNDTAFFSGKSSAAIISANRDGSFTITGIADGTDTLTNVEYFRFSDGQYRWNSSSGSLVLMANTAPTMPSSQTIATGIGVEKQFTVTGTDPDGDPLTFTSSRALNGVISALGDGVFTYTPKTNFVGNDSFTVTASDGRGGTATQKINVTVAKSNVAPTVADSQSISTAQGQAKQVTVSASDADGDTLTYTAAAPGHGTVTGGANGLFTYTPTSGYGGTDSFTVTASDGKGGTATQTVNVTVTAKANVAPTVVSSQNVSTPQDQAKQITVSASDSDGDKLTYTAANAGHGTVTGGANGLFTYTPTAGYIGNDSFAVTVSDGKGGAVTQTIQLQVTFVTPPSGGVSTSPPFQLYMANGQADKVGGTGQVVGTNALQDVTLLDHNDHITFDGSFNRGGDIIRLPGNANEYAILVVGAFAELRSSDSTYTIPLGEAGTSLVFADGVRKLFTEGIDAKIGSQVITATAAQITAPSDHSALPTGQNPSASGLIYLSPGADIAVGGNHNVTGTTGAETVHYSGGNLLLDGSFNRGGDSLYLPDPIADYKAYIAGSNVVLISDTGKITIPVGEASMALNFDGQAYALRYDTATQHLMIGEFSITSLNPADPDDFLGGTGLSLDIGSPTHAESIDLDAGTSYVLTETSGIGSNVHVHGFDLGDVIKITGAPVSEYNFTNGDADNDGAYGDLIITYNVNNISNTIALIDAVAPTAFVFSQATAETALGGQFINVSSGGTGGGDGGGNDNPADADSLDVGSQSSAVSLTLNAGTDYVLNDNASVTSNVLVHGFDQGDIIHVTGVPASEYNFINGDADHDGAYGDLIISYATDGVSNSIAIIDAFAPDAFVLSLSSAETAMGGQFITFG